MFVPRPIGAQPLFRSYTDNDDWQKDLQQKVADIKAFLPLREETRQDLQQYLAEVTWSAIKGEVSPARAAELLAKSPIKSKEPLQQLLGDVLWLAGFAATEQPKSDMKTEFEGFCLELVKEGVLSRPQLATNLDMDCITDAVCQVQPLRKKMNMMRTKLKYTITRYNIFRENNDGYAKMLYLLDTVSNLRHRPEVTPAQASETRQRIAEEIQRLIGYDHLCPNRAVAAILDIFEARFLQQPKGPTHTWAQPLIDLLDSFPRRRLTSVAVFQVLSHVPPPQPAEKVADPFRLASRATPTNFFAIAALAKIGDLIDLEMVWTHLEPSDEVLKTSAAELMQSYEDDVSRLSKVDLSGSADADHQKFAKSLQAWNVYTDQKLKFVAALISVNHWQMANRILLHLSSFCKPCLNHHVRSALCDLLKWLLDPILKPMMKEPLVGTFVETRCFDLMSTKGAEGGQKSPGLKQTTNLDELLPQVREVLDHLEYFLHTDQYLLCAMWKLMQLCIEYREGEGSNSTVVTDEGGLAIMSRHLLPAVSIAPPNPSLNDLMWIALSKLTVYQRYMIYSCWETMNDRFLVKLAAERTVSSAKQILKRVVSNADRRDLIAHNAHYHFNKLCLCNPIPAIETMLKNLEIGFNVNMIQPFVECTARCSDLTADIVGYVLARSCARPQTGSRTFLNPADATLSPWLVNLSEFVGRFYKKHPEAELTGVLTVVAKRVNSEATDPNGAPQSGPGKPGEYMGESLIRVVLESLMECMGGLVTVADMNAEQLHCLSGGPRLRLESTAYGIAKKDDQTAHRKERARASLFNTIRDLGLVRVLLYSLSQQRYHFLSEDFADSHNNAGGMKLLGLLFDGNRECLLKLIEFLSQACRSEEYFALIPPVEEIFAMFEPAIAFHILRHGMPSYARAPPSNGAADGGDATKPSGAASIADAECQAELSKVVRKYLPAQFESEWLSVDFYLTFWRLGLQDVVVPKEGYEKALSQMGAKLTELQSSRKQIERKERERDLEHNREYKGLRKEYQRLSEVQSKLKEEGIQANHNHKKVKMRLDAEKVNWVVKQEKPGQSQAAATAFVTEMMCPRLLTSHADALFCSNFVKLLFSLTTPCFKLVELYNTWTTMVPQFIRCCTEREAEILGIFIREMMSYVLQMRKEETGSKTEKKEEKAEAGQGAAAAATAPAEVADIKKEHKIWEGRICKAMRSCLESDDWVEKRNVLLLLSQSYTTCPITEKCAEGMLRSIEGMLGDKDESDLKTLANSLMVRMKSHSSHWVDTGETRKPEAKVGSRTTKTGTKAPRKAEEQTTEGGGKVGTDPHREAPTFKAAPPAKRPAGEAEGAAPEKRARVEDKDGKTKSSRDTKGSKEARDAKSPRERGSAALRKDAKRSNEDRELINLVENNPKPARTEKDRDREKEKTRKVGTLTKSANKDMLTPAAEVQKRSGHGDDRAETRRRTEHVDSSGGRDGDRARNALGGSDAGYYRGGGQHSQSGSGVGGNRYDSHRGRR